MKLMSHAKHRLGCYDHPTLATGDPHNPRTHPFAVATLPESDLDKPG